MPVRLATTLQFRLSPGEQEAFYWVLVGIGAAFFLMIALLIYRKVRGSGDSGPGLMDTDFLENLSSKGGLTPDEMRKVRDAMLRQAAARERARDTSASLKDLQLMAAAGDLKPTDEEQPEQQAETPPPPPPNADAAPASEAPKPAPQPTAKPKMSPEQLLENGLISQEDYEAIKARRAQGGGPAS